jgi:hypothetical protein
MQEPPPGTGRVAPGTGTPGPRPGTSDAGSSRPGTGAAGGSQGAGAHGPTTDGQPPGAPDADGEPGVTDAIRRLRVGGQKLADAHLELLKAELSVAGRELGIVVGMALAILVLAVVAGLLLAIGTCLFLGEWLFGSMAWGIVHGVLFLIALIVPLALDLAGGRRDAFLRGLVAAVAVTLLLWALFASNVLRDSAVNMGRSLEASLAIEPAFLPTLVGIVGGAIVAGLACLVIGLRRGGAVRLVIVGLVAGALVGAILGSVTFDTKGALAVALIIGLMTWIGVTVLVAMRTGFDPQARYEAMVPRESMAMAQDTKAFLQRQLRRQRGRILGR